MQPNISEHKNLTCVLNKCRVQMFQIKNERSDSVFPLLTLHCKYQMCLIGRKQNPFRCRGERQQNQREEGVRLLIRECPLISTGALELIFPS